MEIHEQFDLAVSESKTLSERPSNETMLQLYSLYKQATEGDVGNSEPANPFDFVARAKYQAWLGQKGKPRDLAMREYIDLVKKLKG
ncbi:MAG TPA: acyl-CoA-binding protein [Chitinophagaceae bacterium]|nr:acyl-CoA-binding protein [Chitinophagaceae bacterium]